MTPDKTPDITTNDGWNEWRHYVLENMKAQDKKLDELLGTTKKLEIELSAIKVKSGLLGTITGGVSSGLVILGKYLLGK